MKSSKTIYTDAEKETLTLKATLDSINSMVNYEVLSLNRSDRGASIRFPTRTHQQFFNVTLLAFLNDKIFGVSQQCMEALQVIIKSPQHCTEVGSLKDATDKFQAWLSHDVQFEHDGEIRKLWFPSINQEVALKITRHEYISICGNISKHNALSLDRVAKKIKSIFGRAGITIEQTQALLVMEDFYEQFHNDLFSYHSSSIAEYLNDIRWAVYEYLQPLFNKIIVRERNEDGHLIRYSYNIPDSIADEYVRKVFWDLMNDVRSEPYMRRFQVIRNLKIRY